MKRTIIALYLFCEAVTLNSQGLWEDSVKNLIRVEKSDSIRFYALSNLVLFYTYAMPDSAIIYAQEEISLAKTMRSDLALSAALRGYAGILSIQGNHPQAIYFALEGLKAAERSGDDHSIAWSYDYLSSIYIDAEDYDHALFYTSKEQSVLKLFKKTEDIAAIKVAKAVYNSVMFSFALIYDRLNEPDSAFKYMQIVNQSDLDMSGNAPMASHSYISGNIYLKKGDYGKALNSYRRGCKLAADIHVNSDIMSNFNGLAKTFLKMNQPDSCIYYANRSLEISRSIQFPVAKLEALSLLADVYNQKGNSDSTVKYLQLSLATKDSLFNKRKVIQTQSISFDEKMRQQDILDAQKSYQNKVTTYILIGGLTVVLLIAAILFRNNQHKQKANAKIEKAYEELKATQAQLIQSEKMASLGELTAGIAHEIQNPLNFVNNFSEVNNELIAEMKNEIAKGNFAEIKAFADDIEANSGKINHHGKRADAIVKSMLQHSHQAFGVRQPTAINALCDECLRLSYHGYRAKDKAFNAEFKTDFDGSVGKINIIQQDMGRVLLNILNNAFYSVKEKSTATAPGITASYKPLVSIKTKKAGDGIEIAVSDNGVGMIPTIIDKIFQPFFTTKPTGQGTGLGLSLAYDIVTKQHHGTLTVRSKAGEGSEFIIKLPLA